MIDSHHHLWTYNKEEYPWIPEQSPLAKNHLIPELEEATSSEGVSGTIVVQARQKIEESHDLLEIANQTKLIKGVVGWVPLIDKDVRSELEKFAQDPKFVGVRHVLQDEPDDYFLRDDFHCGLAHLPSLNLKYDLLLFQRQIPVATKLVDRQPNLPIIINHIAKPEAKSGQIEPEWRSGMKELARRDNITGVKFSGLATEFPSNDPIDPDTIRAYFEESLEIFGSDRLMFGTDWPVALLRLESYQQWAQTVRALVAALSADEKDQILTTNAQKIYDLVG